MRWRGWARYAAVQRFGRDALEGVAHGARPVEVVVLQPGQPEPGACQQVRDRPVQVAAAHDSPVHGGEPALDPGHPRVGGQAVLHEVQLTAGPQHPVRLGERPARVRDRAQRPRAEHEVGALVAGGQRLGVGPDELDRHRVGGDPGGGQAPADGRRVHGQDLGHPCRVVRHVQPGPEADLEHHAGHPGGDPGPHLADVRAAHAQIKGTGQHLIPVDAHPASLSRGGRRDTRARFSLRKKRGGPDRGSRRACRARGDGCAMMGR